MLSQWRVTFLSYHELCVIALQTSTRSHEESMFTYEHIRRAAVGQAHSLCEKRRERQQTKNFPKNHHLHKIINRKTVKLSYSCTPNMYAIISAHNLKVLSVTRDDAHVRCGCQPANRLSCPVLHSKEWSIVDHAERHLAVLHLSLTDQAVCVTVTVCATRA